jgi:Heterokaryon incompatibility protein (HET)
MDAKTARSRLRNALRLPFRDRPSPSRPNTLYHLLNSDNREIRVLRIDPLQPDEVDIHCSLETVSLNSAPAYQALSYEWGPADVGKPSRRVFLNSQEVSTTLNLRLALKHLPPGPACWVDALCINQRDDKERGHQVQLMTRIYQHASAVVVWLGLEEGKSAKGMEFLNEASAFIAERENANNPHGDFRKWLYKMLSNSEYDICWDGLRQLFQRSYWSRLWVIQELVVTPHPDEVWLLCGSNKARFESLRMISQQIDALAAETPNFYFAETLDETIVKLDEVARKVWGIADHIDAWGTSALGEDRIGLLVLLDKCSDQLCADPRDKVYALIGVSSSYPGMELLIMYTIPVADVYKNLARYIIAGSERLDILTYAGHDQCATLSGPSWVPNWPRNDFHKRLIRVFYSSSGTLSSVTRYSVCGNILIAKAIILGGITSLLEIGGSIEENFDTMRLARSAIRPELTQWLHFAKSNFRQTNNPSNKLLKRHVGIVYDILIYPEVIQDGTAEDCLPFEGFRRLCEQVSACEDEECEDNEDLMHHHISNILWAMRKLRQLCSIELASSDDGPSYQNSPISAVKESATAIGLCSRNARVGDIVTVVRGCMHPLLLRPVSGRYELIGEIYVYGFMNGEALERFEEVEIEFV